MSDDRLIATMSREELVQRLKDVTTALQRCSRAKGVAEKQLRRYHKVIGPPPE
jgi:hypothetical protein